MDKSRIVTTKEVIDERERETTLEEKEKT